MASAAFPPQLHTLKDPKRPQLWSRSIYERQDSAEIVVVELGLTGLQYRTTRGERVWPDDSPFVHLDTSKLEALGWQMQVYGEQGMRNTGCYLQASQQVLEAARQRTARLTA